MMNQTDVSRLLVDLEAEDSASVFKSKSPNDGEKALGCVNSSVLEQLSSCTTDLKHNKGTLIFKK